MRVPARHPKHAHHAFQARPEARSDEMLVTRAMFKRSISFAEKRKRPGLVSYAILSRGDVAGNDLAATFVELEPGGRQLLHSHPEVQVYFIVSGTGIMRVGKDFEEVTAGDLIHIPSGAEHGIVNTQRQPLTYFTAATPAFDFRDAYDKGSLSEQAFDDA